MVGGATPDADGSQLVLSLARLNRVRAIDPIDLTMTIEAGVTLKAAQVAAGSEHIVGTGRFSARTIHDAVERSHVGPRPPCRELVRGRHRR
jgi:FAD/FMN-containing dehydrogenase